eukprot:1173679-Prorocentrum_minimum.AAC.2
MPSTDFVVLSAARRAINEPPSPSIGCTGVVDKSVSVSKKQLYVAIYIAYYTNLVHIYAYILYIR